MRREVIWELNFWSLRSGLGEGGGERRTSIGEGDWKRV